VTEPPTGDNPHVDQPAESMRSVALWVVLFLALIGVGFYAIQLIEELTGKKAYAKITLVAIAFAGSMLVRGGFWLTKRLRGDANAGDPELTSRPD
jgi:hypothetical protein